MKHYTLAFLFSVDLEKVLLVRKKSPEWQRGKLNGVGGKFEEGENGLQCIAREVFEETGVQILPEAFIAMGEMGNDEWRVEIFSAVVDADLDFNKGVEEVVWCEVGALPKEALSNLLWLVPFCLDKMRHDNVGLLDVTYL